VIGKRAMFKSRIIVFIFFMSINIYSQPNQAYSDRPEVIEFIELMSKKHQFNIQELETLFKTANFQAQVVRIMDRQPEGTMTWSRYKGIMVTKSRIDSGKEFIKKYKSDLQRAEDSYGVPSSVIASIIGIETRYGKIQGNIRVLDSLSTLSFDYPRRSKFFKVQLEEFLLLCREQNFSISEIKGSIAGAMGYGQFMPDSYRDYAVDFDGDGVKDLLNNPVDAIGSVANFLSKKGRWIPNTPIVIRAELTGKRLSVVKSYVIKGGDTISSIAENNQTDKDEIILINRIANSNLIYEGDILELPIEYQIRSTFKPYMEMRDLESIGILVNSNSIDNSKVLPIKLELDRGHEYWIGFDNYNAISRYNPSKLYIMAVFEFSKALEFFL
jgi:membrane-bound lytic murein transglycosylase B|tara:strand:+ start:4724 stop:5875 length:1152 start_codon:yes stop_codon:yes gene_type:complete